MRTSSSTPPATMSQNAEVLARWQLAAGPDRKVAFETQDGLMRSVSGLLASAEFLELARDFYVTKRGKYDLCLHAWCSPEHGATLTGLVLEAMSPCELVEMEMARRTEVCHPAFGQPEQEPIFRAFLRQVTEIGSEMLAADPNAAKRSAIQSKYTADPERLLAPVLGQLSPKYRSFDERSRRLFWMLFKTRATETPWSYFFYNLILGLDWSPEQMSEAEAAALLLADEADPLVKEKEQCQS